MTLLESVQQELARMKTRIEAEKVGIAEKQAEVVRRKAEIDARFQAFFAVMRKKMESKSGGLKRRRLALGTLVASGIWDS